MATNPSNEVLTKILAKKEITTNDHIKFRTIFDVLSSIFTNENHLSTLKIGYKINDYQQIWFPNIITNEKKQMAIKDGYGNFLCDNWNHVYQFDNSKSNELRKELGNKLHREKIEFVTFAKINDKNKGIGYHFIGVFVFDDYEKQNPKMMIYKKVSDSYKW